MVSAPSAAVYSSSGDASVPPGGDAPPARAGVLLGVLLLGVLLPGQLYPADVGAFEVVLCFVGGDAAEPGLHILLPAAVDVGVGGKEGLLGEVLCFVVVPHHLVADGIDQLLVLLHHSAELFICHPAVHHHPWGAAEAPGSVPSGVPRGCLVLSLADTTRVPSPKLQNAWDFAKNISAVPRCPRGLPKTAAENPPARPGGRPFPMAQAPPVAAGQRQRPCRFGVPGDLVKAPPGRRAIRSVAAPLPHPRDGAAGAFPGRGQALPAQRGAGFG